MKTLFLQCTAGISGDMFAGALLHICGRQDWLAAELRSLGLPDTEISFSQTEKCGVQALKFDVRAPVEHQHRHLSDIEAIIGNSSIHPHARTLAVQIFQRLAEAEARVHEVPVEHVHFHEAGAVDSIIDIVAAALLVVELGIEKVLSTPVSVGHGIITYCHGETTLPVPAVRALLKQAPVQVLSVDKELTTPTGAAILSTLVSDFVDHVDLADSKVGYGAGTRDLTIPNVLKAELGEWRGGDALYLLETNIDDMNPELFQHIIEKIMSRGAVEAFIQPCIMKKNRIGCQLTVITPAHRKDGILALIFEETSTFGIRINRLNRVELERHMEQVHTPYGLIDVKLGLFKGKTVTASPEYASCKAASEKSGKPLADVYDAAKAEAAALR